MASAVNVLTVTIIRGWSPVTMARPGIMCRLRSDDCQMMGVSQCLSCSSNSHKCVIITGLDSVNISNVLHISTFKLWLSVRRGIAVNKMNFNHHHMLIPFTADSSPQTVVSRPHQNNPQWCGHQRGLLWWSLPTMEENFPKYFIIHNNSQPSRAGPGASQNSNWASLRQECEGVVHKCCVNHLQTWSLFPGNGEKISWSAEWRRFIKQLRPQMLQSSKIRNQWVAVPLSKHIPSWPKIWRMRP